MGGLALGAFVAGRMLTGRQVSPMRIYGVLISGALAGVGGAYLASEQASFTSGMSAGRGYIALAAMIAIGALNGFFNIVVVTAFQFGAKEELRGRVMGVVTTVAMAVAPLGMALGGLAGDLTGKNLPLLYGLCGGLIVVATASFGPRRAVREFLAFSVSDRG